MVGTLTMEDLRRRATVSVPEAGELLGLSRNTAYQACKRGEIPSLRLGGRLVVPVAQLLRLLEGESAA
jgi:excisionase family DNA binding protein